MSVGALHGYTVGVTADRRSDEQIELLERCGARVVHGPTIRTLPLGDEGLLKAATEAVITDPPDVVIFTTGLGVRGWLSGAESVGLGEELLGALESARVLVRGSKAEGAAATAGMRVDWRAPTARTGELVAHLVEIAGAGTLPVRAGRARPRVAVQLDGARDGLLAAGIEARGFEVVPVPVYCWELPDDLAAATRVVRGVIDGSIDAVTFTSAPAVTNFFAIADRAGLFEEARAAFVGGSATAVCVGPVCSGRLRSLGVEAAITPRSWRLGAMVRTFAGEFAGRQRTLRLGGCTVTMQGRIVRVDKGAPVWLSDREGEVLAVLADRPGVVVSKAALLSQVWSGDTDDHVVEVTVGRLRQRLERAGAGIETVVRRGYRLSEL